MKPDRISEFCPKIENGIRHLLSTVNSGEQDYTTVLVALHLASCNSCGRKFYKIINEKFLIKFDFHLTFLEVDNCTCQECQKWREVLRSPKKFRIALLVEKRPDFLKAEKEIEEREETDISRSPASATPLAKRTSQTWKAPKDYDASNFELDTEMPGLKYQLIEYLSENGFDYMADFDVEADMGNAELRVRISCPKDAIQPILLAFARANGFPKFLWSDRGFFFLRRRISF